MAAAGGATSGLRTVAEGGIEAMDIPPGVVARGVADLPQEGAAAEATGGEVQEREEAGAGEAGGGEGGVESSSTLHHRTRARSLGWLVVRWSARNRADELLMFVVCPASVAKRWKQHVKCSSRYDEGSDAAYHSRRVAFVVHGGEGAWWPAGLRLCVSLGCWFSGICGDCLEKLLLLLLLVALLRRLACLPRSHHLHNLTH